MNANRYRLIFDKRTGMLIPVAEFTPAARKGNGRGAGEGMGDTTSPKWNRMFVAMTLAAGGLGSSWSLHSQNMPTPDGSTNTTVTQTINGTPLINIANPNNGLSHNRFTDFNVGAQGVVFNNSRVDGVSQIGGSAMKNPHLQQNATGILAEVTGTDISRLQGTMEVFGPAADLLIANPNGLYVNGVSVLNANSLTLTTGTPDATGRKFEVRRGHVEIGAGGLNTTGLGYFDIVARSIALHGDVTGENTTARLAAGLNTLDRTTAARTITKRENGGGAGAPAFGISGSEVGAMHGGHVTLMSTESGLGVRHEGRLTSMTDIAITADGDLRLRRVEAGGSAYLSGDDVSLGGAGDTVQSQSGEIRHWLRVDSRGDFALEGLHNVERAQFNVGGTLTSTANLLAENRAWNTEGRIDVIAGAIDILGGQWSANHDLDIAAGRFGMRAG
ncbi:MAG TPA: filamentous hemagglutinin N-terminal domain-containing protein, partial [Lysobacter sp.]|nr:filamentous hemagglutinin N-terminal domain-containing protein [Lysobacter sp.]